MNQKIEGFFEVCKEKGLTGTQGVVIPGRNVKNLILTQEVIDAVKEGKFSIYPINYVDEGLRILTGTEVGEKQSDGTFPEGTLNARAASRLLKLAKSYKAFGRPVPKKAKAPENNAGPKG